MGASETLYQCAIGAFPGEPPAGAGMEGRVVHRRVWQGGRPVKWVGEVVSAYQEIVLQVCGCPCTQGAGESATSPVSPQF